MYYCSIALDIALRSSYHSEMRVYEVVLRSGAKAEVTAEILHDDARNDNKIYFYRDHSQKQLVAYFLRDEIAGIVVGPDNASTSVRYK